MSRHTHTHIKIKINFCFKDKFLVCEAGWKPLINDSLVVNGTKWAESPQFCWNFRMLSEVELSPPKANDVWVINQYLEIWPYLVIVSLWCHRDEGLPELGAALSTLTALHQKVRRERHTGQTLHMKVEDQVMSQGCQQLSVDSKTNRKARYSHCLELLGEPGVTYTYCETLTHLYRTINYKRCSDSNVRLDKWTQCQVNTKRLKDVKIEERYLEISVWLLNSHLQGWMDGWMEWTDIGFESYNLYTTQPKLKFNSLIRTF
jgi:hypothetical protein